MPFLKAQDIYSFWLMARPINVFIALLTLTLSAFLSGLKTAQFISMPIFWMQALMTALIMLGGYWINDICDHKIDYLNKPLKTRVGPYISTKKALTAYFILSFITFVLNFSLPFKFWVLNFSSMVALYFYAYIFKKKAVLGNLIVAWLTSAVFLAGGMILHLKLAHLWGMIFAFLITFIREVTKDIEDMKGDMNFGLHTLPILIGIRMTKKVLAYSYVLLWGACWLPFIFELLEFNHYLTVYLIINIISVQIPLLWVFLHMSRSTNPKSFGWQSQMLKIIIGFGLVCIYFL